MNTKKATEWIITNSEGEAQEIRDRLRQNNSAAAIKHIRVFNYFSFFQMHSSVPQKITVMPNVPLNIEIDGKNTLMDICKNRQLTWCKDEKVLIVL